MHPHIVDKPEGIVSQGLHVSKAAANDQTATATAIYSVANLSLLPKMVPICDSEEILK